MLGKFETIGNSVLNINGQTVNVPSGASISISNGKVFVDGKEYTKDNFDISKKQIINITINGDVESVVCNGSVQVNGNVKTGIDCGGSVSVSKEVNGNIDCGGSVTVKGDHNGNIDCGGLVYKV